MEDEDEVDVLGDFCLNLETDLNHYDAGEFPAQNSELLGDYMQHPWLLDNSQVWYFDHSTEDKNKNVMESMLQEEKKHFLISSSVTPANTPSANTAPKVSPIWTKEDIDLLKKGIQLHGHDWSKVSRTVGTKTTLQVKSYVKSRREFLNVHCHPSSCAQSPPPQYTSEVQVSNEDTIIFSMDEIVNETEIPTTAEEVIADISGWPAGTNPDSFQNRHQSKQSRAAQSPTKKKPAGRPKKQLREATAAGPPLDSPSLLLREAEQSTPVIIQGEIIRLRKGSGADDDSDSEVDIGGEDVPQTKTQQTSRPSQVVPVEAAEVADVKKEEDPAAAETFAAPDVKTSTAPVDDDCQPVFTFPTPSSERQMDLTIVSDEERTVHWDFFEGRASKTPERYVKIRNSIVHEWRRIRPRYLTKTSVRPALKNCGDVNCISRVHAYLELVGVINFGCEQVQYGKPLPGVPSHRERLAGSGAAAAAAAAAAGVANNAHAIPQPVRERKKRPRDLIDVITSGVGGGGYTIRHDGTTIAQVPVKVKQQRKMKSKPGDPFQLVPCVRFNADRMAPFEVKMSTQALIVVDVHCHLCTTEVIGLLGGHFYRSSSHGSPATLLIEAAQPCRSLATGHQCEMCPVSQTEASEQLRSRGLQVVGWYHSHPTFPALPSVRDLHTQKEFQQWFSRQEAPFLGIIVNPFTVGAKSSLSLRSMIRCITVHEDKPYKHDVNLVSETDCFEDVNDSFKVLGRVLDACPTMVPLESHYPYLPACSQVAVVNYAQKAICSVQDHLEKVVSSPAMNEIRRIVQAFLNNLILLRSRS